MNVHTRSVGGSLTEYRIDEKYLNVVLLTELKIKEAFFYKIIRGDK